LVASEVRWRVGLSADVGCASGNGGLGRSASATAVEDLADLSSARHVPGVGGASGRRDVGASAALEIGASKSHSGEGGRSQDGVGGSAHYGGKKDYY
jgi:hypothetical protein